MKDDNRESATDSNDLVPLTHAAKEIFRSRNIFWRRQRAESVPPPIITVPNKLWSRRQLERFRAGEIQRSPVTGIWYERNPNTLAWEQLPNQYINNLPLDAA